MAQFKVKTKVDNCTLYEDGTLRIDDVRLSHPHLDKVWAGKAKPGQSNTPKFSAKFFMPKTWVPARKLIVARLQEAMVEAKIDNLPNDMKFIRDGDQLGRPELKGMFRISASETEERPPRCMDGTGAVLDAAGIRRVLFAGCYVSAIIRPWGQNNDWGKRVNAGLTAVRFMRKGEPFGQGQIDEDEIDDRFSDLGGADEPNGGFAKDNDLG